MGKLEAYHRAENKNTRTTVLAAATTVRRYLRLVGLRGLTAAVSGKLHHRKALLSIKRKDVRSPFFVRLPSADLIVYRQVFFDLEYELDVAAVPRVIVDAGAHIGLASIYFANRFPHATILAIEPERSNFALLERNVGPYPNVTAIHAALWSEDRELEVVDPGLGNWGFLTRGEPGPGETSGVSRHRVRAVTVESLMRQYAIEHIDLLKLDIEGAEREVLASSGPWIERVGAMAVELHDRLKPGCEQSFLRATANFGRKWSQGENVFAARADSCLRPPRAAPIHH